MFERFTDRARKTLALSNQAAHRLNHEYIGTEHILLGLLAEGSGVAANVLRNLGIDMKQLRDSVEKLVRPGPEGCAIGKLPQTPRAKVVITEAINAAREFGHNYVGTEHLLLGMIREHDGVAAQVLNEAGATLDRVRSATLELLGEGGVSPGAPAAPSDTPAGSQPVRTVKDLLDAYKPRPSLESLDAKLKLIAGWLMVLTVIVIALVILAARALLTPTR